MICSSEKRFFTSNLLGVGNWTSHWGATQNRGGASLPQQNGMVERVIRTLKEQCVHRHRFESQTHALRVIADWIAFHNPQRPHQALKMMTSNAAYAATLTA
ncbi:integrase core domain-containing protein [Xanthomonas oryzae]